MRDDDVAQSLTQDKATGDLRHELGIEPVNDCAHARITSTEPGERLGKRPVVHNRDPRRMVGLHRPPPETPKTALATREPLQRPKRNSYPPGSARIDPVQAVLQVLVLASKALQLAALVHAANLLRTHPLARTQGAARPSPKSGKAAALGEAAALNLEPRGWGILIGSSTRRWGSPFVEYRNKYARERVN